MAERPWDPGWNDLRAVEGMPGDVDVEGDAVDADHRGGVRAWVDSDHVVLVGHLVDRVCRHIRPVEDRPGGIQRSGAAEGGAGGGDIKALVGEVAWIVVGRRGEGSHENRRHRGAQRGERDAKASTWRD